MGNGTPSENPTEEEEEVRPTTLLADRVLGAGGLRVWAVLALVGSFVREPSVGSEAWPSVMLWLASESVRFRSVQLWRGIRTPVLLEWTPIALIVFLVVRAAHFDALLVLSSVVVVAAYARAFTRSDVLPPGESATRKNDTEVTYAEAEIHLYDDGRGAVVVHTTDKDWSTFADLALFAAMAQSVAWGRDWPIGPRLVSMVWYGLHGTEHSRVGGGHEKGAAAFFDRISLVDPQPEVPEIKLRVRVEVGLRGLGFRLHRTLGPVFETEHAQIESAIQSLRVLGLYLTRLHAGDPHFAAAFEVVEVGCHYLADVARKAPPALAESSAYALAVTSTVGMAGLRSFEPAANARISPVTGGVMSALMIDQTRMGLRSEPEVLAYFERLKQLDATVPSSSGSVTFPVAQTPPPQSAGE